MAETFPKVELRNVENVTLGFKKGISKITFSVAAPVPELARLLFFQVRGEPMDVTFFCPQARLDLNINPVDTSTGEIKDE